MKTKVKNLAKVTVLFMILSIAFNNCGQPGEIKFDKVAMPSDSGAGSKDNSVQDNPAQDQNPSQPVNSGGGGVNEGVPPVVAPPTPVGETPPTVEIPPDSSLPPPVSIPVTFEERNFSLKVNAVEKVDILFVIDNSASMASEQSNMADRFHKFIESIAGLDWQIGIITTDVANPNLTTSDGKLLEFASLHTYVIDSKMDKKAVEQAFAQTIQRKELGSGYEQGIYATYRFIERDSKGAHKLLREGSAFSVVIVSDADETPWNSSTGGAVHDQMNKPIELVKYIEKNLPGKKHQFHSIVVKNGDRICLNQSANEAYGDSYIFLAQLTKGVVGSVCASDYGSQLKFMGEKVQELVKSVVLECDPKDINNDGRLDIEIYSDNNERPEIEKVEGKSLFFRTNLSAGDFKIKYFCQK